MVDILNIKNNDFILEPCAGDGVFIKKIFNTLENVNIRLDAIDVNDQAIHNLELIFGNKKNVSIRKTDTLLDKTLDNFVNKGGVYSKIIGNPPYGAWQDLNKRFLLKKKYGGYVKETYTLFISRCIDLLAPNGKLVFIVPDTFLALNLHKDIRKKILTETRIDEILLMPSNFFPGVNFGYSNLCIISLTKISSNTNHEIKMIYINDSVLNLLDITKNNYSKIKKIESVKQSEIFSSLNHSFLLGGNKKIRELINNNNIKLKDIANCVTGFYSGDNKKFIVFNSLEKKIPLGYKSVSSKLIENDYGKQKDIINGLTNNKKYIPFLKGGNGRFKKNTNCFIQWDVDTINFYKKNKASRFQNSQYYFKEGIGVPMVKSNKTHAFLLENRLFDQSIVGVFPKRKNDLYYLLALLNSNVCSKLLRVINHTANNSANYLRSLPIVKDDKFTNEINSLVKNILNNKQSHEKSLDRINTIFDYIYKI